MSRLLVVGILLTAWGDFRASASAEESADAVLLRFDGHFGVSVSSVTESRIELNPNELGVVVWSERQGDRRAVFRGHWTKPATELDGSRVSQPLSLGSARGGSAPTAAGAVQLTTQLDPLLLPGVVKRLARRRHTRILTPPDGGVLLSSYPTIRRIAQDGKLRSATFLLSNLLSNGANHVRIPFREHQEAIEFRLIKDLPVAWKKGLPPGQYALHLEGRRDGANKFRVEVEPQRRQVRGWLDQWTDLVRGHSQPLYELVAVEYLLARQPYPYLADALDVIDRLPPPRRTPYLKWRRQSIVALLTSKPEPAPRALADHATGINAIDEARSLIARGEWNAALRHLETMADSDSGRGRALADLYRGVIHAEWGLGQEQAADFYFRRAIAGLQDAAADDRFRAHNNYANFLLNRTQDRILDHAFQLAAGVHSLFVTALLSWDRARDHYEAASALATQLGPDEQASIQVNLARLYAMLADLVAILDSPDPEQQQLKEARLALERFAAKHLDQATAMESKTHPRVLAVAEAIRAHLAFRAGDFHACRQHASSALDNYVLAGSLVGAETVERLLGLLELRVRGPATDTATRAKARQLALKHFRVSHQLAELLRRRVPVDRIGRTRAGFFARRSYVNEQIVQLLIAGGNDTQALRYAELAKARALQDLLAARDGTRVEVPDTSRDLDDILRTWPSDTLALEYYLTRDRAWVFVVFAGKVKAHALTDDAGDPLSARALIARLEATLSREFNQYSVKLRQRVLDGRGFDHQWQDTLYRLSRQLLPEQVLARLDQVSTLLVVPHHILHYFPFAALVIQPDTEPRADLEMVKPRFLVDASCNLCYAPSLTTWHLLRQRDDRPIETVGAVGIAELPGAPPLPGVAREIRSLQEAFGDRVQVVVREGEASRANTLKLLGQPGLLLIGTHGQNRPDQPLDSDLRLYPRDRDDGRLTAAQLYTADVRSDLIVLSACYTGLAGKSPLPGDDLFSLQRALLQSGGRTVVTGQWDIYDATGPELMQNFFETLARGKSAPNALADSQRRFLKRLRSSNDPEPWLHPYFWAVYTVAGDDRTHCRSRD